MAYAAISAACSSASVVCGVINVMDGSGALKTASSFGSATLCFIMAILLGIQHVVKAMKGW